MRTDLLFWEELNLYVYNLLYFRIITEFRINLSEMDLYKKAPFYTLACFYLGLRSIALLDGVNFPINLILAYKLF